jgi:hypothetical protein
VFGCVVLCAGACVKAGIAAFPKQNPAPSSNPSKQRAEKESAVVPGDLEYQISTTGDVRCDLHWNVSHSETIVSPKGDRVLLSLHGETIPGKTKDENKCRVEWIARFRVDGTWKSITVATRDDEWNREHYFRIVGWSADGERVLLSMTSASGDWDETIPVIYDVRQERIWTNELADVFARLNPGNCALHFRPVGFDPAGEVVVDVGTLGSNREALGQRACFEQSRWKYDFTRGTVEPAEASLVVEKFGTVLPQKSNRH